MMRIKHVSLSAWQAQHLSLFVAGAVLGEIQVSLFVAGAALGEVQVFFFVSGAALGSSLTFRGRCSTW